MAIVVAVVSGEGVADTVAFTVGNGKAVTLWAGAQEARKNSKRISNICFMFMHREVSFDFAVYFLNPTAFFHYRLNFFFEFVGFRFEFQQLFQHLTAR